MNVSPVEAKQKANRRTRVTPEGEIDLALREVGRVRGKMKESGLDIRETIEKIVDRSLETRGLRN